MSGLKLQRHLVAAFGAVLMSSIALGAALAPSEVAASPITVVTYA